MSNASNLSTLANVLDDGSSGQFLKSTGSGGVAFDTVAAGAVVYATADLLPLSGFAAGDMAYVTSTNRFYINNGSGWYSISLVNTNPNITSVADASSGTTPFTLATDQTATVITITAADPEEVPLTYGYSVTSGSLNGSTVAQGTGSNTNVFTVTPHASQDATFTITFTASDGINQATSANEFSLSFVTTVTDSNHTTLLATATPKNATVYRYFKFIPQALRSASDYQICEFELTDGSSYYSPTDAEQLYRLDDSDGDDYVSGQNVAASIDGNTSTKTYNGSWDTKYYLYDMGSSFNTVLTGWRYITGNDVSGRDPVSWTLLGSTNNSDWVLLDQRVNETITTSRSTATQDFTFNATNQAFFNAANTNYPIEVNGDAHAGTFSPYRSGGYSTYFDGSGDYLETTSSNHALGTSSAFTIEFWYYFDESRTHTVFDFYNSSSGMVGKLAFTSGNVYLYDGSANILALTRTQVVGSWEHFCWTRDASNNHVFYINGTQVGTSTASTNIDSQTLNFGRRGGSINSTFMKGYLSDLRIVKGTAITPPSGGPAERLEAVTNTSLLTCHLPYIADGSTNDHSITINGNTSTKPFSPYDYLEYAAADHGGSVYFDGTGDYLVVPADTSLTFGTGDFTLEFWINFNTFPSNGYILNKEDASGNDFTLQYYQNAIKTSNATVGSGWNHYSTGIGSLSLNTWYHIAYVRSGGTLKSYKNGVEINSASDSRNYNLNNAITVASRYPGDYPTNFYMTDFRIVKGTSVYTGEFTPPAAPLATTQSSGTNISAISSGECSLLIKGTDASIIDKSQGANLKLFGNTTGSTTQAKFSNTKSMYFDGNGDRATITGVPDLGDDFTIECWNYATASGNKAIVASIDNVGGAVLNNGYWQFSLAGGGGYYQLQINGGTYSGASTTPLFNQWVHLAVTRTSGTIRYFINGTLDSTTVSNSQTCKNPSGIVIGSSPNNNYIYNWTGYIQDLRISNECKYTANFTPPTAPLEG